MADVILRDFKDADLAGATLVASVPNLGLGGILLTDHLLEAAGMDHVASFDSAAFPPVAMVHDGKARFPVRVHADGAGLAVLRGETPVPGAVLGQLGATAVAWAKAKGVRRIVALDAAWPEDHGEDVAWQAPPGAGEPEVCYVAVGDATAREAEAAGLRPLASAVMAGLSARLLLEGRLQGMDVVGLVAVVHSAEEDARSCVALARALVAFVPGLRVDHKALEATLQATLEEVREVQRQERSALERLAQHTDPMQQFI